MAENRPEGRETNTTGKGKGLYKRGDGLNTGPVGKQDGYQGRKEQYASTSGGSKRATRAMGGGGLIIIAIVAVLLLSKGGLGGLFGGNTGTNTPTTPTNNTQTVTPAQPSQPTQPTQPTQQTSHYGTSGASILSSLLGGSGNSGLTNSGFGGSATASNGWVGGSNVGKLNTSVAAGSRAKRTQIAGSGRDTVTLMIYMCGTDLESRSKMGTMDLQEMLNATTDNTNLNILVYTGGCKQWQNNVVSSSKNELYQIRGGQITKLGEESARSMTDPNTLVGFIKACAQAFPANRNMLILWDHGGGSLSGYGYDEKYTSSGSMPLANLDKALKAAGVTFDFIGFDACLMATLETALVLEPYADYMVASEETEPGVGWYYTNWLTALNKNTSISTLELGKTIVDDFVSVCGQSCRGQSTTLSVVDLAELANTVPAKLKSFSSSTSNLLQQQYKTVSVARSSAREFAASNKIDQVDLTHLCLNLNTNESKALANAILGAVKYNRTSSDMTNSYGLSVYFPYKSTSKVKSAASAFQAIGMDSDYLRCIQQFASMATGGQTVAGGTSSPLNALLGGGSVGSSSNGTQSMDSIMSILGSLMSSGSSSSGGFFGRDLDLDRAAQFIADNQLDASSLVWVNDGGTPILRLSEAQWGLVNDLQLNVFVDDGEGYIDLGLDCVYDFTDDGALKGVFNGSWLAIDEQVVAFYYMDSSFDGDSFVINGRVPCLLNGELSELLISFDNDNPDGVVTGARRVYKAEETETVAKNETALNAGDKIDFLCDYYTYDGDYENTYMLGEQMTWKGTEKVSNVDISEYETQCCYLLTDIYCQEYWTPTMP